jgi:predicted methyltransferase
MTVRLSHVQVRCLRSIANTAWGIRLISLNTAGFSTATVTRLRTLGYVSIENGVVTLTDDGKAFIRFGVN